MVSLPRHGAEAILGRLAQAKMSPPTIGHDPSRSQSARRAIRHRGPVAFLLASVAVVSVASSAVGEAWMPSVTIRNDPGLPLPEPMFLPQDVAAAGHHVIAGWAEGVGEGGGALWVRSSSDAGDSFATRKRLDDDGYLLSFDIGGGRDWATWVAESAEGDGFELWSARTPAGADAWDRVTIAAYGVQEPSPRIAASASRAFVVTSEDDSGNERIRIRSALAAGGGWGPATTLGTALPPGYDGQPDVDSTSSVVSVVWSNGSVRYRRGLIGPAAGHPVTWEPTRDLGAGTGTRVVVSGDRVAVLFMAGRDTWSRVSSDGGVSFGPRVKVLDGDTVALGGRTQLRDVAMIGQWIAAIDDQYRVNSIDGGATWVATRIAVDWSDRRQVAFTTHGGSPKAAEIWLDQASDPMRIAFHRHS